jgi:hypothetical protein
MRGVSVEPWNQVGNNVDNCEDLVDECEKSASGDDDVACRQVSRLVSGRVDQGGSERD